MAVRIVRLGTKRHAGEGGAPVRPLSFNHDLTGTV